MWLAASLTLNLVLLAWLTWRHRHALLQALQRISARRASPRGAPAVLVFGDSRAADWDLDVWLPDLAAANHGQKGQTTAEILDRLRAHRLEPTVRCLVVLCGVNDFDVGQKLGVGFDEIRARAIAHLRALVAEGRARDLAVLIATVPGVNAACEAERHRRTPAAEVAALNDALRQAMATDERVSVVDLASALHDAHGSLRADVTIDGLHFDARGYAIVTELLRPAILRALERRRAATGALAAPALQEQ